MTYKLNLNSIEVLLLEEQGKIRVKTNQKSVLFTSQTIKGITELIEDNFIIVDNFYFSISEKKITPGDIDNISILVVLHYLYMYNFWKNQYKKRENLSLKFNEKDFRNTSTHDIIFSYFKNIYPNDWMEKSSVLLQLQINEVNDYYNERVKFYNK